MKRPEKEMATTARDEDQVSSLSGVPSAGHMKSDMQTYYTVRVGKLTQKSKSCENVADDGRSNRWPEVSGGFFWF